MGEAHLQLSAAVGVESRGRPRYQPGNFFESVSEPAETRRSGALLGVAVPDRAQRSVFVAAAAPAGSELSEPRPRDFGGRLLPIELSLAVESALKVLSEDQREAVLLKVYQGFKFDEMAEILEIPVSTVKSRLYTALDLLKATLAPAVLRKGGLA